MLYFSKISVCDFSQKNGFPNASYLAESPSACPKVEHLAEDRVYWGNFHMYFSWKDKTS